MPFKAGVTVLCCIFALFFFVMYMLPVSLDCPFVIASSVFSNVCLTPSFFFIEVSELIQASDRSHTVYARVIGESISFFNVFNIWPPLIQFVLYTFAHNYHAYLIFYLYHRSTDNIMQQMWKYNLIKIENSFHHSCCSQRSVIHTLICENKLQWSNSTF